MESSSLEDASHDVRDDSEEYSSSSSCAAPEPLSRPMSAWSGARRRATARKLSASSL
jgi:hypothetical protein